MPLGAALRRHADRGRTGWPLMIEMRLKAFIVRASQLTAEPVREMAFDSQTEGCVADDASGALYVNEERLNLDHGYPVRLIGPNRPGVLQTKWVERVVVR